jgi:hypothetical protein
MAENLGVYTPGEVDLEVNKRTIQGFFEGEFIRTERDVEEDFRARAGAKGDYAFEENLNRAGRIVFVLDQNSPDNVYMQSLLSAKTIFPVKIVARHNLREKASANFAMVGTRPRKSMGQNGQGREWVIVVGNLQELDEAI